MSEVRNFVLPSVNIKICLWWKNFEFTNKMLRESPTENLEFWGTWWHDNIFVYLSLLASSMKGLFSVSVRSFHSAPSRLDISELCILGLSWAILRRCPLDQTMNAFIGLLMWHGSLLFMPAVSSGTRHCSGPRSRVAAGPILPLAAPPPPTRPLINRVFSSTYSSYLMIIPVLVPPRVLRPVPITFRPRGRS